MPSTVWASFDTRSPGAMPTSAERSCSFGTTANAEIAPTIATLVRFFAPSNRRFGPKRFLKPLSGSRRLKSGLMPWNDGFSFTWPTFATTPNTRQTIATGATASTAVRPFCMNSLPMPPAVIACGWAIIASVDFIEMPICSQMCGPQIDSANSAESSTIAPFRSGLFATWPFLRASSRRLGVAFSVFSPPPCAISSSPPLRHVDRLEGGQDALLQLGADPAGHERQRGRHDQEADQDLRREADREHVQLRHDPRHDAEAGVGDDQGDQDRRGDLDRRHEDRSEGVLGAADERAERGHLGDADEVVGLREPLHHPGLAADGDEDHHADQRVELRKHGALVAVQGVDEPAVGDPDQRVEDRTRDRDRGEQDRDREREREADERLLADEAGQRERVGRHVLVLHRQRREAHCERHGGHAASAGREHLRREQRRDDEQRADAGEHEEEAHHVLLTDLAKEAVHWPTSPGMPWYRSDVQPGTWPSIHGPAIT